jgi:hypothetical protein
MDKKLGIFFSILLFVFVVFIINDYKEQQNNKNDFEKQNAKTSEFAKTSDIRLNDAVVTLPDGNIIVGLEDGFSNYIPDDMRGVGEVRLEVSKMKTQFVSGVFKKHKPRLDAIVPMYVSADSNGGSMYIVLFWDRGDAAIEQSYMRLGGENVVVEKIDITSGVKNDSPQEYIVDVHYRTENILPIIKKLVITQNEAIIPVINGHFDSNGLVTK